MKTLRKDMPDRIKIYKYWSDFLVTQYLKYWLMPNNKTYLEYGVHSENICFACGGIDYFIHRAHIVPICKGGSNEVTNLHLLCRECHLESEIYDTEQTYYKWFATKDISNSGSMLKMRNRLKVQNEDF